MPKSRTGSFQKSRSFFQENGSYVFFTALAERSLRWVRNRMLARKLGVRRLEIGPRAYLRGLSCIEMGENFSSGDGLWLEALTRYRDQCFSPRLVIGSFVQVSNWCHIACTHSVTIGDHVLIGSKVIITDHNHGIFGPDATPLTVPPAQRPLEGDRSVRIEANVWLGDGVVVCPGVTIGEGSVAGANAVVTADVAPFTVVAGNPARPIRRYDRSERRWVSL